MSVNEKLTAIADEIRELSGTENALNLDDMASNVSEGNDEIDLQKQLLETAITELEGKVDPELYDKGYEKGFADAKAGNPIIIPDMEHKGIKGYILAEQLPAGSYLLTLKAVSNGIDDTRCVVYAYNSSGGNVGVFFDRDVVETRAFTISGNLKRFNFYAETSAANSSGDMVTFSNIVLENVVEGMLKDYPEIKEV